MTPLTGPTFAVSDGAHDGNHDFFFLAPLFKDADQSPYFEPAAFNPTLKPSVEICELGEPAADGSRECIAGDLVKRFEPGDVSMSLADQQYHVNWRTDESDLDPLKFYRIGVLIGSRLLGFADVDPVVTGKEIKNLQTGENIPLVDGRTLPIKFRIEFGALCPEAPALGDATPCVASTINLAQGGGIHFAGAGEDFRFDVPPNTVASIGGLVITDLTFGLEVCDGIDVDLPTVGQCLRVSTFFTLPGLGEVPAVGELAFSNPILISMCALNAHYHSADETRQEGLLTLHQQDGPLILALPHAEPNCGSIGPSPAGSGGWDWLKSLAARLLLPKPAYAETRVTRTAVLHVGAGGETSALGAQCSSSSSAGPNLQLTTCASSPAVRAPAAASPTIAALIELPRTRTDFQFALPAKMEYVDPSDASRTAAPGTSLPTRVKVTDWYGDPVRGARVRFITPAIEGPGIEIASVLSNDEGVAEFSWTIVAGVNTVVATGRGIAAQNNYPGGTVKPFMPDISLPTDQQQPVNLRVGLIPFVAIGMDVDLIISTGAPTLSVSTVLAGASVVLSPWTISNRGSTDATAQVTNGLYLSRDAVITPSDVLLASSVSEPAVLTAGHGFTWSASSLRIPAGTAPGLYYVGILVDATNAQVESNETNNSVSRVLTVIGVTLPGLSPSGP